MLLQQDTDERNKRAALHADLTRYWATHHHTEDSRDADLMCDLKGTVKITIPEGKLGPASMQIFQVVKYACAWYASLICESKSRQGLNP